MIEKQLKAYPHFQPPRERLALLLDQLSELDPIPDKKPKLEAVPARKPAKQVRPERVPAKKADNKLRPARKPEKKLRPERSSFHSVLRESAKKQAGEDTKPGPAEPNFRQWLALTQKCVLGGFSRMRSWLQARYAKSTTKRLRLSEVVSLGDKRFVAIVKVEDREFLIGGATSGLSLLAQLGKSSEPADKRNREIAVEGQSR